MSKNIDLKSILPSFSKKVFIIAEVGINHEGSYARCKKLITLASNSGADAVKIQTMNPELNYCKRSESFKIFKSCELSIDETKKIFQFAKKRHIKIFTTLGDLKTYNFIKNLNPFGYKISSGLLNHFPLVKNLLKAKKPLFISTGMANSRDLKTLKELIRISKKKNISIFHCVSEYPTPKFKLNLDSIKVLQNYFLLPVGYSDHTIDINIPCYAVMAGARVIEKHFTDDEERIGYDHKISFSQKNFKKMVEKIRSIEKILYSQGTILLKKRAREKYSRCIVANTNLQKNDVITKKNIIIKRPINEKLRGAEPDCFEKLLGKRIKNDILSDHPISLKDLVIK